MSSGRVSGGATPSVVVLGSSADTQTPPALSEEWTSVVTVVEVVGVAPRPTLPLGGWGMSGVGFKTRTEVTEDEGEW